MGFSFEGIMCNNYEAEQVGTINATENESEVVTTPFKREVFEADNSKVWLVFKRPDTKGTSIHLYMSSGQDYEWQGSNLGSMCPM